MLNTKTEHDRLVTLLVELGRPVACGFEATGNYHRPIAWRLLQAGFDVRLVSSLALALTREALHNGWDKNDPKDAQVILHMVTIGASQGYHDPLAAGINDVQELSKTHEAISRAKTDVQRHLHDHYSRSPAGVVDGTLRETDLDVLLFVARADGRLSPKERLSVTRYVIFLRFCGHL